ncbi:MAG: hypothetical protein F6K42_38820, partial [Leptolyngbya sp. SIO1D8]|nr:hypothetical protein [Leptolyngbya sp. SIO1D8]
ASSGSGSGQDGASGAIACAAYTFSVNQLQGTPSWILFDAESTILAKWFGHKSEAEMTALVNQVLEPVGR